MKSINSLILLSGMALLGITACIKENILVTMPPPELSFNVGDTVRLVTGETVNITNTGVGSKAFTWSVSDSTVAKGESYEYVAGKPGTFKVVCRASNEGGTTQRSVVILVIAGPRLVTASSSAFIAKIFEFLPAPGQFINTTLLGLPESANSLIGGTKGLISLGGYGGYVVFGFDHSIKNVEGTDFAIYGNAFDTWSEPGIVQVMADDNGNGLPDDVWYEIKGSEHDNPVTVKNYSITYYNPNGKLSVNWKDNRGNTGFINYLGQYHTQEYYPSPVFGISADSITFNGTLLRSPKDPASGDRFPRFVEFEGGYTDNFSKECREKKYNEVDIENAVDQKGRSVGLKHIDFVRVYTGCQQDGGAYGELSTEVGGAADLSLLKK